MSVHAYEDPGRPEGGHAVLLLHGLTKPPTATSFRLKPGDASVGADASGWPHGDLKPLAARITPEGLELQLGPEITENEMLLPGTLVEIEVASAEARGEFLWPNVAPVLRPKRRTLIVNGPKRKGAATVAKAESSASDADSGAAREAANSRASPGDPASIGEATVQGAGSEASTPADAALARQKQADVGSRSTAPEIEAAAVPPASATAEDAPAPAVNVAGAAPAVTAPTAEAVAEVRAPSKPAEIAAPPAPAPPHVVTRRTPPALVSSLRGSPPVLSAAAPGLGPIPSMQAGSNAPSATLRGARPAAMIEAVQRAMPRSQQPPADAGYAPRAHDRRMAPQRTTPAQQARRNANLAQVLIGVAAMGAALFVLSRESAMRTVAPQPQGEAATTVALTPPAPSAPERGANAATESAATPTATAHAATPLFDALSVGALSPRGTSSAAISPARALENANAHLTGQSRDPDEAGFWLRRYLTQSLGSERTLRALTQLGSVYAEPSGGKPDYLKARALWEIASASGDPVAMCFLGLLSENGLGGPMDKRAALVWYERSKLAGGCPSVDDAIARVRQ